MKGPSRPRKMMGVEQGPAPKPVFEDLEPSKLVQYSDSALQKELDRRAEEKKAKREKAIFDLQTKQGKALTMVVIDAFLPKHGRTSCSDTDVRNGWGSNGENEYPRCNRCAAIELMNITIPDGEFIFRLSVEKAGSLEEL